MWLSKSSDKKDGAGNGSVAVAVDRDKSSQQALKWAADHLVTKGQSIFLIHVNPKPPSSRSTQGTFIFLLLFTFFISHHRTMHFAPLNTKSSQTNTEPKN